MKALKQLVLGETWLLPVGIVVMIAVAGAVLRPLLGNVWHHAGGFILLAGALALLLASVARGARPRSRG